MTEYLRQHEINKLMIEAEKLELAGFVKEAEAKRAKAEELKKFG